MRTASLIVAAGTGTRMGPGLPKQYRALGGVAILRRTVEAVSPHVDDVRIVIHANFADHASQALAGLDHAPFIIGGATRAASVRAGLEALASDPPDYVFIHDAARPFTPARIFADLTDALMADAGACPVLHVVDALWHGETQLETPHPRDGLMRAQTPQAFRFDDILQAHRTQVGDFADDVAVARGAGLRVAAVQGDERNFKITTSADMARAAREVPLDIRVGNGFDVHRLVEGDHVTLCGIDIPFDRALSGHSDADVAMHAITDAIFGALAEGDIGQWFPPSDMQWKGAASHIFLEKAVERVTARGGRITHLDCTIICEMPKIGPIADAMRARIAQICGLEVERISVKATTSERLGFTGRGEGIAAQATATVVLS